MEFDCPRHRPWHRHARRSLTAALSVLVLATAACGDDAPPSLAGVVREPALDVADVTLPSTTGEEVTMRAGAGDLLVVYFGYTSCPDICPTTMSDISIALAELDDERAQRVAVAFATVDPDRDTTDVLEGYLDHFFERGIALRSEDPAAIAAAATAFGVQYQVADHEPGDEVYDVAHTAVTYVVDDTGTVVVEWPFGAAPDDMAHDLDLLLDKERT